MALHHLTKSFPDNWRAANPRGLASRVRLPQHFFSILGDIENDAETRFAAHHAVVSLSGAFQRKNFVHGVHAVDALNASVSCESIDVPEYHPLIDGSQ